MTAEFSATFSPAQFFDDVCPKLLEAQREACAKLGGSYAIKLGGDGGGTWTLDFGTASVAKGLKKRPDLTLEISTKDFALMMAGSLDIPAALQSRRVKLHGDARKITNLAVILGAGLA